MADVQVGKRRDSLGDHKVHYQGVSPASSSLDIERNCSTVGHESMSVSLLDCRADGPDIQGRRRICADYRIMAIGSQLAPEKKIEAASDCWCRCRHVARAWPGRLRALQMFLGRMGKVGKMPPPSS